MKPGEPSTSDQDPGGPPAHSTVRDKTERFRLVAVADQSQGLSALQAHEVAYRFVARYYDYERIVPILHLLKAISSTGDRPDRDEEAWGRWQVCVQETLDGAPLPELPPPWDT